MSSLEDIKNYLEKVVNQQLPINHQIIYQLQDVFNLLPDINLTPFVKAVYVKTNDQMLVVYLASLIRFYDDAAIRVALTLMETTPVDYMDKI